MAEIYAGGYSPRDTFDFMKSPHMMWMQQEDFNKITNGQADLWKTRDLRAAQYISSFSNINFTDSFSYTPLDAINQLQKNNEAWNTANRIINNNSGSFLAFDTETIGAFGRSAIDAENSVSGITEIGYVTKQLGRGRRIDTLQPQGSFVFGIDKSQKEWLEESLEKLKRGEELTDVEASGLERASRYSVLEHNGHQFKHQTVEFGDRQLESVISLNESNPRSVKDIESGISTLYGMYTDSRDDDIKYVAKQIAQFSNKQNSALVGYNLSYDIDVLNYYFKDNMNGIESIGKSQYVDIMYGLRAYAEQNGESINALLTRINGGQSVEAFGRSGVGNLEALLEALGNSDYAKLDAHDAFKDSIATLVALLDPKLGVVIKGVTALEKGVSSRPSLSIGDNLMIQKNGYLRDTDLVTVNGLFVESNQVTNQYWQYQGSGFGDFDAIRAVKGNGEVTDTVVKDAEKRFVAKFTSSADADTVLYKTFDTEEDFNKWLYYNTKNEGNISADIIQNRKILHDKDIARREIDSFFQPNGVSVDNKGINGGGYEEFSRYFDAHKRAKEILGDNYSIENVEKNIDKLISEDETIRSLYDPNKSITGEGIEGAKRLREYRATNMAKVIGVFEAIDNNEEFYGLLREKGAIEGANNFQRTMFMKNVANEYFSGVTGEAPKIFHSIEDMSNVYFGGSLIDTSDIDVATRQIQRAFKSGGISDVQATRDMMEALSISGKSLGLNDEAIDLIKTQNAYGNKAYVAANDIATALYIANKDVRSLDTDVFGSVMQELITSQSDFDTIASKYGIGSETVGKINARKDHLLSNSAASVYAGPFATRKEGAALWENRGAYISNIADREATKAGSSVIFSDILGKESGIVNELRKQGYKNEDIEEFIKMFGDEEKGANVSKYNRQLGSNIKTVFYATNGETADFMFFTRGNDQGKLIEILSNLDENAKASDITKATEGVASAFKIPYIKRIGLEADKDVYDLIGHNPEIAIVGQGDSNYGRYATMSLTMYKDRDGVLRGRITDSGSEYLLSSRRVLRRGMEAANEGNYHDSSRILNNINESMLTEAAGATETGQRIENEIIKGHRITENDMIKAGVFSMSGSNGLEYKDQIKEISSLMLDVTNNGEFTKEQKNVKDAMEGLFEAFHEHHGLGFRQRGSGEFLHSAASYSNIINSEEFSLFSREFMTGQSGLNMADERTIADYISSHLGEQSSAGNRAKALQTYLASNGKGSMIGLMYDMLTTIKDIDGNKVDDKLISDFGRIVAARKDSTGTETMYKNNSMYIGNNAPVDYSNNPSGSIMRPTYPHYADTRGFALKDVNVDNIAEFEKEKQVRFDRVIAPEKTITNMRLADEAEGFTNAATRTRTSILGTVKSISDTDLQRNIAGLSENIEALAEANGLDPAIARQIYEDLSPNINMYEGKAYMRASVANLEPLQRMDPKTVRMMGIKNVMETGTSGEIDFTNMRLKELVGKEIKSGEILGRKNGKNIVYKGPTTYLTDEVVAGFIAEGKASVLPSERQSTDIKIQMGLEKATSESFYYDEYRKAMSRRKDLDIAKQISGFSDSEFAKYTDMIEDAIFGDASGFRTTVVLNTNVNKHLTDIAAESAWNVISQEYIKEGKGDVLAQYLNQIAGNESFFYDEARDMLGYTNTRSNGRIILLNKVLEEMREGRAGGIGSETDINSRILNTLNYFEENNSALVDIRRQATTIYESESFKIDARAMQSLMMVEGDDDFTKSVGAEFAELLRSKTAHGNYDKEISKLTGGMSEEAINAYNSIWKEGVLNRRGKLSPKNQIRTLLGIQEAITELVEPSNIPKNVVSLDLADLFQNIPDRGTGAAGYENYIFKVDGKFSDFIEERAKIQGVNLKTGSNVYKIDVSNYNIQRTVKGSNKKVNIKELYLPFQNIDETLEAAGSNAYLTESARTTINFLNTLREFSGGAEDKNGKVQDAFDKLFKSFSRELDAMDKESLANALFFKMPLPNSGAGLGIDAVVPYLDIDSSEYNKAMLELKAATKEGRLTSGIVQNAQEAFNKRQAKIDEQVDELIKDGIVSKKLLTTGNNKYNKLILQGGQYRNAAVMGVEMFDSLGIDTGHTGFEVFTDYFSGVTGELKSFEKKMYNGGDFRIRIKDIKNIGDNLERTMKEVDPNNFLDDWGAKIKVALRDVMNDGYKKSMDKDEIARAMYNTLMNGVAEDKATGTSALMGLEELLTSELMSDTLGTEFKHDIIKGINKGFADIGEDYLENVGTLGILSRYPLFHDKASLPTRFFLDRNLSGRGIRVLGPQFSIFENLDFDGDKLFAMLLGNGGLGRIDSEEYKNLSKMYKKVNDLNTSVIENYLRGEGKTPDYLKTYNYGDLERFRFDILSEMDKPKFNQAKEAFLAEVDDRMKPLFESVNEEVQTAIMANSKEFGTIFDIFDAEEGFILNNKNMARAAMRARGAKDFIGNFSKVNYNVRDTLAFLFSNISEEEDRNKLINIKNALIHLGNGPAGILTATEQTGIDTKHVHDADLLNKSSRWREGMKKLFLATQEEESVEKVAKRQEFALREMIQGSRKVFLKDDSNITDLEIAKSIMSRSLEDYDDMAKMTAEQLASTGFTQDRLEMERGLRGLLDLANFSATGQNGETITGYRGFIGLYKQYGGKDYEDLVKAFSEEINKNGKDIESIFQAEMKKSSRFATDEALNVNGRKIGKGSIIAVEEMNLDTKKSSVVGYVYNGNNAFQRYNFQTGKLEDERIVYKKGLKNKAINKNIQDGMVTIKGINESISENPRHNVVTHGLVIDFFNTEENRLWNINDLQLNTGEQIIKTNANSAIRQSAMDTVAGTELNKLFNLAVEDGSQSIDSFEAQFNKVAGFDFFLNGQHTDKKITMSTLIGDDAEAFREKAKNIYSQIALAQDKGTVFRKGTDGAALIRQINNEIAKNPRSNVNRFDSLEDFLGEHIDEVVSSRSVFDSINKNENVTYVDFKRNMDTIIDNRERKIGSLISEFREDLVTSENMNLDDKFSTLLEERKIITDIAMSDIMETMSEASEEDIFSYFNWDLGMKDSKGIIATGNMKIGYGEYTGRSLDSFTRDQIDEIYKNLYNLDTNSLDNAEKVRYNITVDLLNNARNSKTIDFKKSDLNSNYISNDKTSFYKQTGEFVDDFIKEESKIAEEKAEAGIEDEAAEQILNNSRKAKETIEKEVENASEASGKKTLRNSVFNKIEDSTKKKLKIGGAIMGGLALTSLVAHHFRNKKVSDPNVPVDSDADTTLDYEKTGAKKLEPMQEAGPARQAAGSRSSGSASAPPTPPKHKWLPTIYHDPNSGYKFKVSAKSYNKLVDQAYEKLVRSSGGGSSMVRTSKDNSGITDNWLENKFTELME